MNAIRYRPCTITEPACTARVFDPCRCTCPRALQLRRVTFAERFLRALKPGEVLTSGQLGLKLFRKVATTSRTFSTSERASISRAANVLAHEGLISLADGVTISTFRAFINASGRQALEELREARAELPHATRERLRRVVEP